MQATVLTPLISLGLIMRNLILAENIIMFVFVSSSHRPPFVDDIAICM